jgi:hypothetical protein
MCIIVSSSYIASRSNADKGSQEEVSGMHDGDVDVGEIRDRKWENDRYAKAIRKQAKVLDLVSESGT